MEHRTVRLLVFKPAAAADGRDYHCQYAVVGLGTRIEREVWGVDATQALLLAVRMIAAELETVKDQDFKGSLRWSLSRTNGDLGFPAVRSGSPSTAQPRQRIAVEAQAMDIDNVPIEVLMHVVQGRVSEIEIYRADGAAIKRMPPVDAFSVVSLPPPPPAAAI